MEESDEHVRVRRGHELVRDPDAIERSASRPVSDRDHSDPGVVERPDQFTVEPREIRRQHDGSRVLAQRDAE